jgi:hypothetical protein
MATFTIVGSSTVTITGNAALTKGRLLAIIGSSTVTVTSAATMLKRRLFNIVGAGLVTIDSAATMLKRRLFTAVTGTTVITVSSSSLTKTIVELTQKVIASRIYVCTITGAADSLPDLEIPISSINISHNAGTTQSSMFITCPNGAGFSAGVIARKNGGIVITATDVFIDGTSESVDFDEYPISGFQSNQGAKRHSISIQGATTIVRTTVNAITVPSVSFISLDASGAQRVRMDLNKDMLPGDVLTLPDSSSFIAGNISMLYGKDIMFMEVTKNA